MKQIIPYLMDAAPAITAATVTEVSNINPYIEAVILIISGITALIRLYRNTRKPGNNAQKN